MLSKLLGIMTIIPLVTSTSMKAMSQGGDRVIDLSCDPVKQGELLVVKSNQCVDTVVYAGTGNIGTYLCDGHAD